MQHHLKLNELLNKFIVIIMSDHEYDSNDEII